MLRRRGRLFVAILTGVMVSLTWAGAAHAQPRGSSPAVLAACKAEQKVLAVEFTTGKVMWKADGLGRSSFAYADGLLYVHAWKGDVGLVEATPEGYREKGRFTPSGQPKPAEGTPYSDTAYAHPVIANGVLYIRDAERLWAYDIKAGR